MLEKVPETISLTVGTAGHIDHGKTSLVTLLTGCNTDSLPEEQSRGMTIDLGYAACTLPNNRQVGIVDVPGHERFIHNMVAGATGIDVVLLVVAADDGVMPQTIEHFHIVRLLGVPAGMVAITKIDIVSPERVAEVEAQVRDLIAGSFLEGCPVVPVSAKTAAGYDRFYDVFVALVDKTVKRDSHGPFRMHIEGSFVLKGRGTVVNGIPCSGKVSPGDVLEVLPAGRKVRAKSVQVYGNSAETGRAGECVALNISDVSHEEAARGMALVAPGYFAPARFINARVRVLTGIGRALRPRTAIRLHIGTSDVPGHLVLPTLESLAPGGESFVQIQLRESVVAAAGDLFVVRLLSPAITVGGGRVISTSNTRMRRTRGDWAEECRTREAASGDPGTVMEQALKQAGKGIVELQELAAAVLLDLESTKRLAGTLVEKGVAVELRAGHYAHSSVVDGARGTILSALGKLHDARPLSVGFQKKELFRDLQIDHTLAGKALDLLKESGTVKETPSGLQVAARAPSLTPAQCAIAEKIVNTYLATALASPRRDELPGIVGAPSGVTEPIVNFLLQSGEIVEIDEKVILHRTGLQQAEEKLTAYLKAHGEIDAVGTKTLLGTTRKYAIPVLEYFDRRGLTRRTGDKRTLR